MKHTLECWLHWFIQHKDPRSLAYHTSKLLFQLDYACVSLFVSHTFLQWVDLEPGLQHVRCMCCMRALYVGDSIVSFTIQVIVAGD